MVCFKRRNIWYFFAAHTFRKLKENRSLFVKKLAKFKYLLFKELHYLADAPKIDKNGNKTIICFDKSNNKQYISSKKEGKFTGLLAFSLKINGIFVINDNYNIYINYTVNLKCSPIFSVINLINLGLLVKRKVKLILVSFK
ncbi:hypothetical protein [Buchnera aphidicola]|uniref:hypothetical protein n=1 Tax=Buchnera aphidicola TaxID=9 RepID=UPI0021C742CC|nr:hypothetical protein [Buchnera aphidicola]